MGIFTQRNLFNKNILAYFTPSKVLWHGLTLDQLGAFAHLLGLKVRVFHANNTEDMLEFRRRAKQALASGDKFIVVNFSRKKVGEIGGGHFSPLAAYDAKTDRFLLMDVARYKYPPVWIKTAVLWRSMNSIDLASKIKRGYLLLSKKV